MCFWECLAQKIPGSNPRDLAQQAGFKPSKEGLEILGPTAQSLGHSCSLVEQALPVNLYLYSSDPSKSPTTAAQRPNNATAQLRRSFQAIPRYISCGRHRGPKVHLMLAGNHCYLIKDPAKFAHSYRCQRCDKVFNHLSSYRRHLKAGNCCSRFA